MFWSYDHLQVDVADNLNKIVNNYFFIYNLNQQSEFTFYELML
jgi:hypothetical protein